MTKNTKDGNGRRVHQQPRDRPENWPIIHSYTRAQALEDGVLVDLSEWAKETGFRIPVACTAAVWNGHIVPPESTRQLGQSERGRAHDLLWMLYVAIRGQPAGDRLEVSVLFLNDQEKHETVTFVAVCGPGDHGEPVITIMLPGED